MTTSKTVSAWTIALAVCVAAASASSAQAASAMYGHRHAHARYAASSGDVTVRKSAPRPQVEAHDAFHGPAAFITAPIEIAGTFVSLPFRALDVVFPAQANDPRVVVGAPLHLAGQIATFPFYAVNSAFGVETHSYR